MMEVKNLYDVMRLYTVTCPSCHRWMRMTGADLNNESKKLWKCPMCRALSRREKWVNDGSRN